MTELTSVYFDEQEFDRRIAESLEPSAERIDEESFRQDMADQFLSEIKYVFEINKFIVSNKRGQALILDPNLVKAFRNVPPEVLAVAKFDQSFSFVFIEEIDAHVNFQNWVFDSLGAEDGDSLILVSGNNLNIFIAAAYFGPKHTWSMNK